MAVDTKIAKTLKSTFSREPLDIIGYKVDGNSSGTLVFKIIKINKKKTKKTAD